MSTPSQTGIRDIDLAPALAALLKKFIGNRTSGFLFETSGGLPMSPRNSIDPAGFDASSPNFYVYVGNDPTDGIDPYGLKCIRKLILVTAYSDPGPGKDWPYFAPKKRGGKPGGAGPGIVAVANTNPPPYPFGSSVTVSNNPDPFGSDYPLAPAAYNGTVHDTGAV
jgi:hypothetical protein